MINYLNFNESKDEDCNHTVCRTDVIVLTLPCSTAVIEWGSRAIIHVLLISLSRPVVNLHSPFSGRALSAVDNTRHSQKGCIVYIFNFLTVNRSEMLRWLAILITFRFIDIELTWFTLIPFVRNISEQL